MKTLPAKYAAHYLKDGIGRYSVLKITVGATIHLFSDVTMHLTDGIVHPLILDAPGIEHSFDPLDRTHDCPDMTIRLSNDPYYPVVGGGSCRAADLLGAMFRCPAQLYEICGPDATALSDGLLLFDGYAENIEAVTQTYLDIRLVNKSRYYAKKQLASLIVSDLFPDAPSDVADQPVPVVYGRWGTILGRRSNSYGLAKAIRVSGTTTGKFIVSDHPLHSFDPQNHDNDMTDQTCTAFLKNSSVKGGIGLCYYDGVNYHETLNISETVDGSGRGTIELNNFRGGQIVVLKATKEYSGDYAEVTDAIRAAIPDPTKYRDDYLSTYTYLKDAVDTASGGDVELIAYFTFPDADVDAVMTDACWFQIYGREDGEVNLETWTFPLRAYLITGFSSIRPATVTASSSASGHLASSVNDGNDDTYWTAASLATSASLTIDLGDSEPPTWMFPGLDLPISSSFAVNASAITMKVHNNRAELGNTTVTVYHSDDGANWTLFHNTERLVPSSTDESYRMVGNADNWVRTPHRYWLIAFADMPSAVPIEVSDVLVERTREIKIDELVFTHNATTWESARVGYKVGDVRDQIGLHFMKGDSDYDDRYHVPVLLKLYAKDVSSEWATGTANDWEFMWLAMVQFTGWVHIPNITDNELYVACYGWAYGSWIDEGGRSNSFSQGGVIQSPVGIVESILRDYVGLATGDIDYATFDGAENSSVTTRLNITEMTGALDAIRLVMEQSTSAICFTPTGRARMCDLTDKTPTPVMAIHHSMSKKDSFSYYWTSVVAKALNLKSQFLPEDDEYAITETIGTVDSVTDEIWTGEWPNLLGSAKTAVAASYVNGTDGIWEVPHLVIQFELQGSFGAHLEDGDVIELHATSWDPQIKVENATWSGRRFWITGHKHLTGQGTTIRAMELF